MTSIMQVTATEFKAKCLKMLDTVNQSGEAMEITKHGRVVAVLTAPKRDKAWKRLRGRGRVLAEPEETAVAESDIASLQ